MASATVERPAPAERVALSFGRVLASEWIKLRTLRSTWITYVVAMLVADGLGALIAGLRGSDIHQHGDGFGFDPVGFSLHGLFLAQLAIGVLGVLFVTGEYATGSIRASMTVVPRRVPVLVSKAIVLALVTFVIAVVMCVVAFFAGQAILSTWSLGVSITHAGAVRAILGGAVYLVVIALMGLGFGFAIRSTGGAIATLFGVVLVLPLIVQALPQSWQDHISKFLPLPIADSLTSTVQDPGSTALSTGWALALLAAYAVAVLGLGLVVLRRRDV